jgi:Activator of Hsp90 ATPase homolog 1-like protein
MSYGINHQVGITGQNLQVSDGDRETFSVVDNGHERQWRQGRDTLEFWFSGFCQKFNVKELRPGKRVAWKSPKGQGSDGWEETEVPFELSTNEKQTFIQFRHSGWRESTDFQGHCSMRWAVFLLSLKDVLERGKGRPIPYDLEVHYR